jgi:exopolysaccharide biosynthesis WecB/TagA/CpsF family protein/anti-anti-sigma factor
MPSLPSRLPTAILGVRFDNVTLPEALARVEEMIASRRPHYIATANTDFVVQAMEDADLRRILFNAPLILCDGTPLMWTSYMLGNPLVERVAGSDVVPALLRIAEEKGYRVFFLGGQDQVRQRAVANVAARHPKLQIAGHFSPPYAPLAQLDHDTICREIRAGRPDLLFVSFGCPKQEKWIDMHYRQLGVPVSIGVGATIDFLAGAVHRAPRWMQRSGLEWSFRLVQEPRRLAGRYAADAVKVSLPIVRQCLSLRQTPNLSKRGLYGKWAQSIEAGETVLDLSGVEHFGSTDIGVLMWLAQQAGERGASLTLASPPKQLEDALRLMRLEKLLPIAVNLQREPTTP